MEMGCAALLQLRQAAADVGFAKCTRTFHIHFANGKFHHLQGEGFGHFLGWQNNPVQRMALGLQAGLQCRCGLLQRIQAQLRP